VCANCTFSTFSDNKYELVVIVVSYSLRTARRNVIREFWANKIYSTNKNWRVLFVTGVVQNKTAMIELKKEAYDKNDVLIVDVAENYDKNLPKKDMVGIEWAHENLNFNFLLKCDDDLFIDIDSLIDELVARKGRLFYLGNVMYDQPVLRTGRYAVSKEMHPEDVYKPYCSGGAFVLSKQLVDRLIPHFEYEKYLRIEDAHMGGRVAKVNGTSFIGHDGFLMWNDECHYKRDLLASHPAPRDCMVNLTKRILKKKIESFYARIRLIS